MESLSAALDGPPPWDPSATGHALFASRLGVCGLAWGMYGLVAVQLPEEAGAEATRTRLLRSARRRRAGGYTAFTDAGALPPEARAAIAGIQQLLAGRGLVGAGMDVGMGAALGAAAGALLAPQEEGVLPDLRTGPVAAQALPDLAELRLDWHGVSDFHRQVYALARAIAPGQTRSYGDLAQALGGAGLSRAVGQALGLNPFAPVIPCHRILAGGGRSGGFSAGGGTRTKLVMLEGEGAFAHAQDGGTASLFGD